jgi:hypothetical protein
MGIYEIQFNYQFDLQAQGVFSVTFDGGQIFYSEEQVEGQGLLSSGTLWLPSDAAPGTHTLVFELVPGDGPQSEVLISGLAFGVAEGHCFADFNGDGDLGTDADIEAFFACLGGNCCPTCGSADFNGDGDVGTDLDIESFFRVLAGGPC